MKRSTDRILTTHTGSLPRPDDLIRVMYARESGVPVEPMALAAPVALAASCGFMLPVGTPPNAIAYASGRVGVGRMVRAGAAIDAIGIVTVTLLGSVLVGWVLGD